MRRYHIGMELPDLSDALIAAPSLLGWKLLLNGPYGAVGGYIVETEAYQMHDPASHSFKGRTKRNGSMFRQSGTAYVYLSYGLHLCLNIVTGATDDGQAVLIRALEPTDGIELMQTRRRLTDTRQLTNGPGKLTQALGVDRQIDGVMVNQSMLCLVPGFSPADIVAKPRIGIQKATDQPWRFYVANNPYVSKL